MKKTIILACMALACMTGFAQSEKYTKAMEKLVAAADTTWNTDKLVELSNSFERIADAEKTQWLPYYYAALTRTNAGYAAMKQGSQPTESDTDPYANKAEELIKKAEALSKDNSEIYVVKKMLLTLRMIGNPMQRYMTDGAAAGESLATAKKLNPENPRVYLQEAIDKINTPEQFGGSKEEGKKILGVAQQKFDAFKPESAIHPHWGANQVKLFMNR